jgi:hypothetical protein
VPERFADIIDKLAAMTERFTTLLDRVDVGLIPDGTLNELPLPSRLGTTRVGRLDPNKLRILHAMLAPDRTPRLHHPPGHLPPAQATRQTAHRQTRPITPLVPATPNGPHHYQPARPS